MTKNQILMLFLIFFISCKKDMNSSKDVINYKPIGYFETPFTPKTGAPRQGQLLPETRGKIILDTIYTEALEDLKEFEYIIVLFHFHKSKGWESKVKPPKSEHAFGLFATRSPRRPNPIGLSVLRLVKIEKNILTVEGVDAFDGTPVLDIKPYLISVDNIESIKNEQTEKELGHHDDLFIRDTVFE